jgi:hypothetical protein
MRANCLTILSLLAAAALAGCAQIEGAFESEPAAPRGVAGPTSPSYAVDAAIDPESGRVRGRVTVTIPSSDRRRVVPFRVFPNLEELATGFVLTGGHAGNDALDETIVRVSRGSKARITLAFAYTLPKLEQGSILDTLLGGGTIEPGSVGLLGRQENGVALGHWLPLYLPPGASSSPELGGSGDLGNFAASTFRATLRIPSSWTLVSSGVTVRRSQNGGTATYREQGRGLRDFGVYLGENLKVAERRVGRVKIRAWAQADHADRLDAVTETTAAALRLFSDSFGEYPWPELDVVDTPLGAGVGGMEWPAMVWIGSDAFAGDIPGLGGLGDLFGKDGEGPLGGLFDTEDLERLGLGGALSGLETAADWVIVHEVAHEWWFGLVGSDSLHSAALDEPLAQYSSCLFWRELRPAQAEAACETNMTAQYRSARLVGIEDAPADRPTEAFDSALQYGAIVYGKAPGLYLELERRLGRKTLVAGLRSYVRANAFGVATEEELLRALTQAAPGRAAEIRRLWRRWMEETHGDDDLDVSASSLDGAGARVTASGTARRLNLRGPVARGEEAARRARTRRDAHPRDRGHRGLPLPARGGDRGVPPGGRLHGPGARAASRDVEAPGLAGAGRAFRRRGLGGL